MELASAAASGDEPLILGMDIGGSCSATAVIGCVSDGDGGVRVAIVDIWQGASAVLEALAYIEGLIAAGRPIREVVLDPMRFALSEPTGHAVEQRSPHSSRRRARLAKS